MKFATKKYLQEKKAKVAEVEPEVVAVEEKKDKKEKKVR